MEAIPLPLDDTLSEPVWTTVVRDLSAVGHKLTYVILPRSSHALETLRQWDLWGPLLLCLFLATALSASAPAGQASLVFAAIFVIIWVGAAVVTLNAQLLGAGLSFFQTVCILGYCIFPLAVAALVTALAGSFAIKASMALVGFAWATAAALGFLWGAVPQTRRALCVYPVVLFYLSIAWIILVQ
jgi:hypothetical protein